MHHVSLALKLLIHLETAMTEFVRVNVLTIMIGWR